MSFSKPRSVFSGSRFTNGVVRNAQHASEIVPHHDYWLDTDSVLLLDSPLGTPQVQRWQAPAHAGCLRPALILLAGESVEFDVKAGESAGAWLRLSFCAGLPRISADGLELALGWFSAENFEQALVVHLKPGEEAVEHVLEMVLPLAIRPEARLGLRCLAGHDGDSVADWLAVRELIIADKEDIPLARARAFGALRAENEHRHFSVAYSHPMYVERFTRTSSIDALVPSYRSLQCQEGCRNAYDLGHAWLDQSGGEMVPDFTKRLRALSTRLGRPVRMVSLCSGAGGTESALLRGANVPVEITLVDIDDSLLQVASARDWGAARVETRRLDVNRLDLPSWAFDVALCVSGAHHLVELEHVFSSVRDALAPGGELWLIGEQIGPNGNQLDKYAQEAANQVFATLPARLRVNQRTGAVDEQLPNVDCSEATFEGIRSADIEEVVQRYFRPLETCRRNIFLWRITGPDYVLNYDISDPSDREILRSLVRADIDGLRAGLRPTELHGAYRPIG